MFQVDIISVFNWFYNFCQYNMLYFCSVISVLIILLPLTYQCALHVSWLYSLHVFLLSIFTRFAGTSRVVSDNKVKESTICWISSAVQSASFCGIDSMREIAIIVFILTLHQSYFYSFIPVRHNFYYSLRNIPSLVQCASRWVYYQSFINFSTFFRTMCFILAYYQF